MPGLAALTVRLSITVVHGGEKLWMHRADPGELQLGHRFGTLRACLVCELCHALTGQPR